MGTHHWGGQSIFGVTDSQPITQAHLVEVGDGDLPCARRKVHVVAVVHLGQVVEGARLRKGRQQRPARLVRGVLATVWLSCTLARWCKEPACSQSKASQLFRFQPSWMYCGASCGSNRACDSNRNVAAVAAAACCGHTVVCQMQVPPSPAWGRARHWRSKHPRAVGGSTAARACLGQGRALAQQNNQS